MDKDRTRDLNAAFSRLPTPGADFKPEDSKCSQKAVHFPKKHQLHRSRETGWRAKYSSDNDLRIKVNRECSSSDDPAPRRSAQHSQLSVHLKDIFQDNSAFSSQYSETTGVAIGFESTKDNGAVPKKRETCMSLDALKGLIEKSADEILLTILDKEAGFTLALEENFNRDCIAYILLALGKAVSSDNNKNVAVMLNIISSNNNLFLVKIQQYLVSFKTHESEDFHLHAVVSSIKFLQKFQICLPSNLCDVLIMLLPLLKETCESQLCQNEELKSETAELLQELEEVNTSILNKYSLNQIKETSRNEKLQLLDPPEDYRSIPVLASEVDIQQPCVFLRPSVIKGQYQNADHYLDVQYRLLREDYVRPLREGISQYLAFKDSNKSLKQIKDIKVYPFVQILKQEFVNGELLHMACIYDKKFAKIKWEFSKRLLSKSLLCLSSDNFKTMIFATVARRDPKELAKGLLFLRFEEFTDEILNLDPSRNFVVIETSAYFEAYRYNLDALLELRNDTLPMKRYIVDTQKAVLKPQYLNDNVTYDMKPVLLPLSETSIKREIKDGEICYDYNYPDDVPERLKNVAILNDSLWPTYVDLNLDPSQYTALKAALTKEFTIIQGPPGTGKTYVGLRIAQILLHNVNKWQRKENASPILVVCYTNHALDQFLEGILTFTENIVRIGGRGSNEAVADFQINNLKSIMKSNRAFPHEIFYSIRHQTEELNSLKESVEDIKRSIANSYTSIFSEEVLSICMTSAHYKSLKSKMQYYRRPTSSIPKNIMTYEWLLGIQVQESDHVRYENFRMKSLLKSSSHSFLPDEDDDISAKDGGDSEEEDDIEHIVAQRDINPDEFAGASYDVPLHEDKLDSIIGLEDGWQLAGGKQGLKHFVRDWLSSTNTMDMIMAKKIKDVWALPINLKWSLYRFWLEGYIRKQNERITELQQQIRESYNKLQEMRTEEDIYVCKKALVIGMTTTGAAKYRHIVQSLNPRIVIVEEAAEILESHIVTSLTRDTQHLILIGDHQQLRPSPTVHLLATKYGMNISLFERMIENGLDCHKLEIQHRMRPEIASLLVPHIYTKLHNHESVKTFENIKGVGKNVFFINHSYYELQENDSKSKVNIHEANFMLRFCKYLINQGYEPSQITVLTTYSGQLFEFKKSPLKDALQGVRFTVVDNYQGEEKDIILISFVRSNEEGQIGFLKISNRVCVALSRAKKGLYCIGNFGLLAEKSDLWKNIVETLEGNNAIGPSLLLICQNHPENNIAVTNESDFDFVPEGGCTQQCEYRLSCGHLCFLKCHPYDSKHEDVQCPKPCVKKCSEGHLCKMKCFEECPPCSVALSKTIEICGHTIQVPCCLLKEITPCTEPCEKLLPCGHECHSKCGEPCTSECSVKISIESIVCYHEVLIECSKSEDDELLMVRCEKPCDSELPCGHRCSGSCGNCYQGRLHVACKEPCNRKLVCGHDCKSLCHRNCPPCEQACENYCIHKKCAKKCGEPCEQCKELCEWSCPHKKCTRLCSELCNRSACSEPCTKILECKHPCIGVCGELCPAECRICDKEKVEEACLGREIEVDAMFICLEECRHIFELNGLKQLLNLQNRDLQDIRYRICPTCKTVIRKPLCFERNIESWFKNIEKIKKAVSENEDYNDSLREVLRQQIKEQTTKGEGDILRHRFSSSTFHASWARLKEAVGSDKRRNIQDLSTIENIMNIMKIWSSSRLKDKNESDNLIMQILDDRSLDCKVIMALLGGYIPKTERWLDSFITKNFLAASEEQLKDLSWEVLRLELIEQLSKVKLESNDQASIHMDKLVDLIETDFPFREAELTEFISELQNLNKCLPNSVVNISELQILPVLTIMSFSVGHWFLCKIGHAYSAIKCGNTTQESKCYECDRKITYVKTLLPNVNQPEKKKYPAFKQSRGRSNGRPFQQSRGRSFGRPFEPSRGGYFGSAFEQPRRGYFGRPFGLSRGGRFGRPF